MHAPPVIPAAPRSHPAHRAALLALLLLAITSPALVQAQTQTFGQWSPVQPNEMAGVHVNMALVRGDGSPFHSRVVWWGAQPGHGGVLGWRNDEAGCNAFPDPTLPNGNLVPLTPWTVTQNIFCGGQTILGTGELLSVGGSDATLEGLRDALTYSPAGGSNAGTWTTRTPMGQHRWYPSATVLREGYRVLVTAGHKYDQLWSYGGRRNGLAPDGYLVDRCGRIPRGNWDPSVVTIAASAADGLPPPREGHTLAYMDALNAPFMFGGKDGGGNPVPSEVWYLTRENGGDLASDYEYPWTRLTVTGTLPPARSDHIAVAASTTDMIVFGGVTKVGGTETPLNDLWRLHYNSATTSWTWTTIAAAGPPPSARFGHTAVYDEHVFVTGQPPVRRLIVFGGTTPGQVASDAKIYIFKFDPGTFTSGTWSDMTLASGPEPRYDHTMTLAPHPWGTDGKRIGWMYGGRIGTASTSETLWRLHLGGTSETDITWEQEVTGGPSPGGRIGHVAIYDPVINTISIFGGSTAAPPDRRMYQIDDNPSTPNDWGQSEEAAVSLSNHAVAFDPSALLENANFPQAFARIPEIYDHEANSWTALPGAGRAPNYYPVNFLVPRTPFSATTCRVIEVGDDTPTRYLDIPSDIPSSGAGVGPWKTLGEGISGFQPDPGFNASTGVMYRPGKVLIAGGTTLDGPTNLAATLDVAGTTGWVPAPTMTLPRYYHNLVLLPTGGVMAIGGLKATDPDPKVYYPEDAVRTPEYWEPGATDWFDYAETGAVIRNYHSTAILMPDGRVLTGGGWGRTVENGPGTVNPNWKRLQLFCPPYLFDANGNPALRPVIVSAPATLRWRQRFTVCVADTTNIRSACLIRPGATTHSVDMNQRFVPLTIEGHAGSPQRLFLTAPASPDSAPPGDYLLFLLGSSDGSKIPSIARWVLVQATGDDLCDQVAPASITDFTPDVVGSTGVWFTWTGPGDDGLITASGPPAAFDLRGSSDESIPALAGSPGWGSVTGLNACSWNNFTVSAWDDNLHESTPVSVAVQTTCGGGGGGSGEFSAHQVSGGEDGAGGASPSSAPTGVAAVPSSAPSATGHGTATIASAGSLQPATGLLVVETRREGEGTWRVTLHLRETPADPDLPPATITVEQGGAGGERDTLGRFMPGAEDNVLGLCALRERGRLGIPGVYRIDQVAPHLKTRGGDHVLAAAIHSRLGALGSDFIASGGAVEIAIGDSLVLIYNLAAAPLADAASWYVLVRRTGDAPPIPMGSRRGKLGEPLPSRFALHQNRPNPFRGTTLIAFDLPVETPVTLEVFDLLGRRVATLADGPYPAGTHSVEWDLRDLSGTRVRPGVYAYRLSAGTFRERRKMNVLE